MDKKKIKNRKIKNKMIMKNTQINKKVKTKLKK